MLLITGAPRNGLSLLAQYLSKLGLTFSPAANHQSSFEDPDVLHINNDILQAAACRWNHAPNGVQFVANGAIEYRIASYLANHPDIDVLKDPRFTFTHHIWQRFVGDVDLLVSFREPGQAALSFRNSFGGLVSQAVACWQQYYVRLASLNAAFVEFGADIDYGDYEENVGRAVQFLDIEHQPTILSKIYNANMIHTTKSVCVLPPLTKLYHLLQNRKEN